MTTNYYKAHMRPTETRAAREVIEFFEGDGSAAVVAFEEIVARAKLAGVGAIDEVA